MGPTEPRHLVVTVHGIRTFGQWQGRLGKLLKGADEPIETYHYTYGYFSVFAFLVPFLRWIVARRFRTVLLHHAESRDWDRIDLVGHSFGTYLIGAAIRRIPADHPVRFHTVILAGSVLRSTFPWHRYLGSRVGRVVNDCGIADSVLILSQVGSLGTGMAGRVGFSGVTNSMFRNRYFNAGHSGYFLLDGQSEDAFMQRYWVPLLTANVAEIEDVDERGVPTALQGAVHVILNNFEPVKITIYAAPFAAALWVVFGLYAEAQIGLSRVYRESGGNLLLQGEVSRAAPLLAAAYQIDDVDPGLRYLLARAMDSLDSRVEAPVDAGTTVAAGSHDTAGNRFAAISGEGTVLLWDLSRLGPPRVIDSGASDLAAVRLDPTGELVLTVSRSGQLRVFDWNNGDSIEARLADVVPAWPPGPEATVMTRRGRGPAWWEHVQSAAAPVRAVRTSWGYQTPGGAVRVRPAPQGSAWFVIDTETGSRVELARSAELGDLPEIGFSRDGAYLYVASCRAVLVWDAQSGKVVTEITDYFYECADAVMSPDGRWLAVGGDRSEAVLVYQLPHPVARWELPSPGGLAQLHFSPDSRLLAVTATDELVRVWDVAERRPVGGYFSGLDATGLGFTDDREHFLGVHDGGLSLWRRPDAWQRPFEGKEATFVGNGARLVTWTESEVALSELDTSKLLATWAVPSHDRMQVQAAGDSIYIQLRHDGGSSLNVLSAQNLEPRSPDAISVDDSPLYVAATGELALFRQNGGLDLVESSTGRVRYSGASSWHYGFLGDERLFFTSNASDEVVLRCAADGFSLATFPPGTEFSADGRLAAGHEGECPGTDGCRLAFWQYDERAAETPYRRIEWSDALGEQLNGFHGFSPDGRYAVAGLSGSRDLVRLDVVGRRITPLVREAEGAGSFANVIERVSFSPDAELLGTTHGDLIYDASGMPKIWNLQEGRIVVALSGATGLASEIVFSPSGELAVTYGRNQVRLWAATTGQLLNEYQGRRAMFSPDSEALLIEGGDDVRLVSTSLESRPADVLVETLCAYSPWRIQDDRPVPASQLADAESSCRTAWYERLLRGAARFRRSPARVLSGLPPLQQMGWGWRALRARLGPRSDSSPAARLCSLPE